LYLVLELRRPLPHARFELVVRRLQRFGAPSLAGEIARDLREAHAAAEAARDAAAVHAAAVLPHVIALVNRAAAALGFLQLLHVHAGGAILGREQRIDAGADDLVGRIAEHPLRAGIPGIDDTVLGGREDRVVERAVDQRAQALFALAYAQLR